MTNLNAAATSGELLEGKHSLTPEIIDTLNSKCSQIHRGCLSLNNFK